MVEKTGNLWGRWLVMCQGVLLAGIFFCLVGLRYAFLPWRTALICVAIASLLMASIGFFSLLFVYLQFKRGGHPGGRSSFLAVGLSLLPVMAILVLGVKSKGVPPIHDITTDTDNPPAFAVLAAARQQGENSAQYAGEAVAEQQAAAYPDVTPLMSNKGTDIVYASCLEAVQGKGWEVAEQDPDKGRIEAVSITSFLRFKDDVVIRVAETTTGSRVDIRSASRVGVSDFGKNAARVKDLLQIVKNDLAQ